MFSYNIQVLSSIILAAAAAAGLWKTLKNSLNCLLTKHTFPRYVFCAESQDRIVQTCNGLGAPKTSAAPHPCVSPGMFAFPSDLDL